jgi:hypothetical protein
VDTDTAAVNVSCCSLNGLTGRGCSVPLCAEEMIYPAGPATIGTRKVTFRRSRRQVGDAPVLMVSHNAWSRSETGFFFPQGKEATRKFVYRLMLCNLRIYFTDLPRVF